MLHQHPEWLPFLKTVVKQKAVLLIFYSFSKHQKMEDIVAIVQKHDLLIS